MERALRRVCHAATAVTLRTKFTVAHGLTVSTTERAEQGAEHVLASVGQELALTPADGAASLDRRSGSAWMQRSRYEPLRLAVSTEP